MLQMPASHRLCAADRVPILQVFCESEWWEDELFS